MEREKIILFTVLLLQMIKLVVPQDSDDDSTMFRLPKDLVPENYDLYFHIEPENDDFSGTTNISFRLANETSTVEYVYLHADTYFITITSANLNDADNCTHESLNNYIVKFSCGNITEENNFIYIEYNGKYSGTDGYGLVKASYMDDNKKQYLVESYFEPTFARRAFPCFDEPDFKAIFSIKITNPSAYITTASNTIPLDYDIK